jgi:hypothetical protein
MLRRLYRCAVRLHPSSFRRRFGDEMVYIFDRQKGTLAALGVTLDCIFSLFRQWTLRPHTGIELSAPRVPCPTADHIPSFETLDAFRPRASAIINGVVLSVILFCMTVVAIRYSWSHVLNLHIREIGMDWDQQVRPQARPSRSAWLQLDPYVGEYISRHPPAKISIRIEGDHLSLAFAGHPSLVLSPVSPKRFIIDGVANNYADFAPVDQGGICCLSVVINANVVNAQRE